MVKPKTKKTACTAVFFVWRRRRDLNSRAGCPTYTLSRGASSPLEYFSVCEGYCQWSILTSANCKDRFCKAERFFYKNNRSILEKVWRRGWDSNPRALSDKRFSRPPRYDRFDTPPYMKVLLCSTYDMISYSARFVKCFCEKSRGFVPSFFRHIKSLDSSATLCYTDKNHF